MEEFLGTHDFVSFESRHRVFNEIMETLRDENVSIIGICGMGGIGKTTLVKEIGKKAKEEGLFDNVVMTEASQDPDLRRMQGMLADMLRLVFKGTSEADRAAELSERLKKERRVLIIMDDVWEKLSLADIGMPSTLDHKCCKLVLTTRRAQVCNDMCCQRMFHLNVLDDDDALSLFGRHARITPYGNPQYHSKAKKVVEECCGLPLAIETVGSALRNKTLVDYDDAIWKLSRSAYVDIESVDREIYPAIKLSLDYLNCEETVRCLTLFSLYPEDRIIDLEEFTQIAFGMGLFENVNSIEEARQNTLRCVTRLLDACLLLPSEGTLKSWNSFHQHIYEKWNNALVSCERIPSVQVHDIVRDVALWLSRKDKFFYMQKSPSKRQSKEYENAIAISMKDCGLDCRLKCPKLKLLLVETSISGLHDGCFETMSALQVLDLIVFGADDMEIFPQSVFPALIQHLQDLRTLLIFYDRPCPGKHLSVIAMLKNLQILSLHIDHIKELPQEIEELSSLKLLDVRLCWNLKKIPQNVLSRLTALEELYLGNAFEVEKDVFLEITSLPHLTALTARINSAGSLPNVSFRKPLQRYTIDYEKHWRFVPERSRNVLLDVVDCSEMASLQQLFPQVEYLYIKRLQGTWENLFPGCSEDPLLRIDASDVDCLIDTRRTCHVHSTPLFSNLQRLVLADMSKMTRLCNGPPPPGWLPNLGKASIFKYHGSQNIVPHIIPIGSKLQVLRVEECLRLKHIFEFDPQHLQCIKNEMSLLPSPHELYLRDLRELTAIWRWPHQMEVLDLIKNDIPDDFYNLIPEAMFRSLNALARLEMSGCERVEEVFQLIHYNDQKYKEQLSNLCVLQLSELWQLRYIWKGPQQNLHLRKLESIVLRGCSKVTSIFTPASATSLQTLRSIKISNCEALESIISAEEDELSTSAASLLMVVSINIPELEEIYISSCPELKSILPVSILAQGLPQLRDICIADCAKLEQVFGDGEGTLMNRDEIALNSLKKLELVNLPSLVHFSTMKGRLVFRSLKELTVKWCPLLGKSFRIDKVLDGYIPRKEQVQDQNLNNEVVEGQLMEYCQDVVQTSPLQRDFVSQESIQLTDFHEAKELFELSGMIIDQPLCSLLGSRCVHSMQLLYLERLFIHECPNLRTLFTSTIAGALKKLEMIEIGNCINLETILVMSELDFSDELPFFPALSKINIKGCNKLKSVLPLSVAQELPQLQSLEIENCPVLQHVFSIGEGQHTDYGNSHEIKLPNLRSLKLAKVPSSMLFTSTNLLVSYPDLQDLFIEGIEASQPTHLALRFLDTEAAEPSETLDLTKNDSHDEVYNLIPEAMFKSFDLNQIWREPLRSVRLCYLTCLCIYECPNLRTLFTSTIGGALEKLKRIEIGNCINLETILVMGELDFSDELPFFPALSKINIKGCNKLKSVLPLSVAQELPRLQSLKIENCPVLQHIFSADEGQHRDYGNLHEINLPNLRFLKLAKVPSSMLFTSASLLVSYPKLQHLFFEGIEASQPTHLALRFLDTEAVVFNEFSVLNCPWKSPINFVKMTCLSHIQVGNCVGLKTLFTQSIAQTLCFLETIVICNCQELEYIIEPSDHHVEGEEEGFSTVTHLERLREIKVEGCERLKFIFPLSVAQRLPSLQEIIVKQARLLEQVIVNDERTGCAKNEVIVLPYLRILKLEDLPRLSRIFPTGYSLSRSSVANLEEVFIANCIIEEGFELRDHQTETLDLTKNDSHDEVYNLIPEAMFKSFDLNQIWREPLCSVRLRYLKCLCIYECPNLRTLFTSTIAGALKKLEMIEIGNCINLETILVMSELDFSDELPFFPALSKINIKGCNKLKSVLPLSVAQELPRLQSLDIENCSILQHVFSANEGQYRDYGNLHEIKLPNLRSLKLAKVPSSMLFTSSNLLVSYPNLQDLFFEGIEASQPTHLALRFLDTEAAEPLVVFNEFSVLNCPWKSPINFVKMTCLSHIQVGNCVGLKTLFTQSIAQTLRFLETIVICNCQELEYIIEPSDHHVEGEEEGFSTVTHLERLREIKVEGCERLKFIFPLSVAQRLPSLQEIIVKQARLLEQVIVNDERTGCAKNEVIVLPYLRILKLEDLPRLSRIFPTGYSLSRSSVANLEEVFIANCIIEEGFELRDHQTETLDLTKNDSHDEVYNLIPEAMFKSFDLNQTWREPLRSVRLRYLRCLYIYECPNLRTLFTSTIAGALKKLEMIEIGNCINLETILVMSELDFSDELPFFPALSKINIKGCNKLKSVLRLSAARELPLLQSLEIENCPVLQHVFSADEGQHRDYGNWHEIRLSNLRSLKLAKVPSSMLFTSTNLLVSYPNLQDLFFEGIEASQPTHLALRFLDTEAAEPSTLEGMDASDINDVCLRLAGIGLFEPKTLEGMDASDINDVCLRLADIRLFEPKVVLNEFPVLNCPWKSPTNFVKMTCLSYIQVGNCVGLKTLFTQSIAQTLCSLETIVISNCQELEYIVEPSDHHVEGEEESFSAVTHLERLREIKVEGCERLKFIFPLSVAQRLPSLQEIVVKGAKQLEQVIGNDEGKGRAKNEKTVLPCLRILRLEDLPRLSRIFPTGYGLSRSSVANLEEVFIANCNIQEGFDLRNEVNSLSHEPEALNLK